MQEKLLQKPLYGYDKLFLEIEAWMRMKPKADDNKPLLLLFPPGVDQAKFFTKFLSYHNQVKDGIAEDIYIPVFASLGGPFAKNSHVLYSICNTLREKFDLSQRVSLNDQQLKKYFYYMLGLATAKLEKQVTSDADIVLFFECVDRMREGPNVRGWLPKKYPERVKAVLACEEGKETEVLIRLDCITIKVGLGEEPVEVGIERIMKEWAGEEALLTQPSVSEKTVSKVQLASKSMNPDEPRQAGLSGYAGAHSITSFPIGAGLSRDMSSGNSRAGHKNANQTISAQGDSLEGAAASNGERESLRNQERESLRNQDRESLRNLERESLRGLERESFRNVRSTYKDGPKLTASNPKDFKLFNARLIDRYRQLPQNLQHSLQFCELFFSLLSMKPDDKNMGVSQSTDFLKLNMIRSKYFDFNAVLKIKSPGEVLDILAKTFSSDFNQNTRDHKQSYQSNKRIDRFVELIKYLALANKGLSEPELERLTNMPNVHLQLALTVLSPVLLHVDGCYRLHSDILNTYIMNEWIKDTAPQLLMQIGETLETTPNSIRKLEEQVTALLEAKEWFQLKQTISTIENFLILFNPVHKYALGQCWGSLIGQNYDPVVEYNKSLELFEMHYQPTIENLFRIVLQLSRFFKELVDFNFETIELPEYRHPQLRNRLLTVKKVQQKSTGSRRKTLRDTEVSAEKGEPEGTFSDSRLDPLDFRVASADSERMRHIEGTCKNHLEDIGLLREVRQMHLYDKEKEKKEILQDYEKANVDIGAGAEQYLHVFRRMIAEKKEKDRKRTPQLGKKIKEGSINPLHVQPQHIQPQQPAFGILPGIGALLIKANSGNEEDDPNKKRQLGSGKSGSSSNLKKNVSYSGSYSSEPEKEAGILNLTVEELQDAELIFEELLFGTNPRPTSPNDPPVYNDKEAEQDSASQYFYKRWLWIMFPWACMSIAQDGNFSEQMKRCFYSDLKYIKVEDELEFTKKAQQIAIDAKMKKRAVLEALSGDYLLSQELKNVEEAINREKRLIAEDIASPDLSKTMTEDMGGSMIRRNTSMNIKRIMGEENKNKAMHSMLKTSTKQLQPQESMRTTSRSKLETSMRKHKEDSALSLGQSGGGVYLTAVDSYGPVQSYRSLKPMNTAITKKSIAVVGYSDLELNHMGNACNTPIAQLIQSKSNGAKDVYALQRMMRDVRDALQNRSHKEIAFMENKNSRMVSVLNDLVHSNAKDQRRLDSLLTELKRIPCA